MRHTIENAIRTAAAEDPDFRAALIADPAAAIATRFGAALPDDITIRVVEEAADEIVLILPADRTPPVEEQLLDIVSGGVSEACSLVCKESLDPGCRL